MDNQKKMKNDRLKEQYRINERIRVPEVRLVGDNVTQGVYPIERALQIAEAQEMDLVEISPNADPPVCTIAQWAAKLYGPDIKMAQGLGTGLLFKDNIPMPIEIRGNKLWRAE